MLIPKIILKHAKQCSRDQIQHRAFIIEITAINNDSVRESNAWDFDFTIKYQKCMKFVLYYYL